jgi:hypothetical protein
MTDRDEFAKAAMQGLIARLEFIPPKAEEWNSLCLGLAADAYDVADAMLTVRTINPADRQGPRPAGT